MSTATVTVRRHVTYTATLEEGREVELQHEPANGEIITGRKADGGLVVGYLSHDEGCENPLTNCDGMGAVYDYRPRHSSQEERGKYESALGIDPETGEQDSEEIDPYAVLLDVYEHSGTWWSIHGEGTQCRWDTSRGAGVWVPDDSLREELAAAPEGERRELAVKLARQAVEEYNCWLAGDCWGVITEEFDAAGEPIEGMEESGWGLVGIEYAREELAGEVASICAYGAVGG